MEALREGTAKGVRVRCMKGGARGVAGPEHTGLEQFCYDAREHHGGSMSLGKMENSRKISEKTEKVGVLH